MTMTNDLIPQFRFRLFSLTAVLLITFTSGAGASELSEADRIALLEKLDKVEALSDQRVSGMYRKALEAYREAIRSDDATMDLYLKCYEKVNYEDQKRKSQEFRDWKRRNKERISSPSMRMALRHQLSWLLLSIEAAKREGDVSALGERAISHLDQIFKHAEVMKEDRRILNENALSSVFARAYGLHIKIDEWPRSALDIAQIYDKVILPPLRYPGQVRSLRLAWKRRINHEMLVHEKWAQREGTTIGKKDAIRPPALEKFLAVTRPQLLWRMEVECFNAGDQKASALRMLGHLETYISHKNAPEWINEFQEMINPEEDPKVVPDVG